MTLLSILGLGFVLGMRHATDSDHVVAVATIVSRERTAWPAAVIGALWGLGHTLTIMIVGGAIVLFDLVIPPRLGLSMEASVGVMLVILGVLNVASAARRIDAVARRSHHEHPEHAALASAHGEMAPHANGWLSRIGLRASWQSARVIRPLFVGVVHGLAGSAGIALWVLTTISEVRSALLYLAVFGLGTLVGMTMLTGALSTPLAFAAQRHRSLLPRVASATGLLSIAFGVLVLYQIGVVDGLFTGHPHWSPR